jgi:GNAT superfamily N-acetyltransferase
MRTGGAPEIHPVTRDRWDDLVDLFERPGPRGSWPRTAACYCMFWRLVPAAYEAAFRERSVTGVGGGPNKKAMAALVTSGAVPGLLAYHEGVPVGWVSVAPVSDLARLQHVSAPGWRDHPADGGTWSIGCFYVHRSAWRAGVGGALLEAAAARAIGQGATAVEGYPVKAGSIDPYTGFDAMFQRAGFSLVQAGRGKGRALWRKRVSG